MASALISNHANTHTNTERVGERDRVREKEMHMYTTDRHSSTQSCPKLPFALFVIPPTPAYFSQLNLSQSTDLLNHNYMLGLSEKKKIE